MTTLKEEMITQALTPSGFTVLFVTLVSATCQIKAGEILVDSGFDTPAPGLSRPNYSTSLTGPDVSGVASADGWYLWNNPSTTTYSDLLTSTDPSGGGYMEEITSGGASCGLYQYFAGQAQASASVDDYVLSATARLYLFTNDGDTRLSEVDSSTTDA